MTITRRGFGTALTAGVVAARAAPVVRIGVTDWNIELGAKIEAIDFAAANGFDGIEVSLGRERVEGKLALDNAALLAEYVRRAKEKRVGIAGTCLDILNRECLKNSDRAVQWVRDGVRITRALGAGVMLIPFFGKDCSAETAAEIQVVADQLKALAPVARQAGVVLGLENWLSAEENARILDRVGSEAVRVYYDVGNSTRRGRDVVKEIRWLGASRICQVHLKENPITLHFGEGKMDFAAIVGVLMEIGFHGWANMEMSFPAGTRAADLRRNQAYLRALFAPATRGR